MGAATCASLCLRLSGGIRPPSRSLCRQSVRLQRRRRGLTGPREVKRGSRSTVAACGAARAAGRRATGAFVVPLAMMRGWADATGQEQRAGRGGCGGWRRRRRRALLWMTLLSGAARHAQTLAAPPTDCFAHIRNQVAFHSYERCARPHARAFAAAPLERRSPSRSILSPSPAPSRLTGLLCVALHQSNPAVTP